MEQLTLLPNPLDPNALTRQTRKVERLQRELRREVARLENLLEEAETGRVGLPTDTANRPNRADIFAQ